MRCLTPMWAACFLKRKPSRNARAPRQRRRVPLLRRLRRRLSARALRVHTSTSTCRWWRCLPSWSARARRLTRSAWPNWAHRRARKRKTCVRAFASWRARSSTWIPPSSLAVSCSRCWVCRRRRKRSAVIPPTRKYSKSLRRSTSCRHWCCVIASWRKSSQRTSMRCRVCAQVTAACTQVSTKPSPQPGVCPLPIRTCRTFPCARSSGAIFANASCRLSRVASFCRPTTRRLSCACSRIFPATRTLSRRSPAELIFTLPLRRACSACRLSR